MAELSRPKVAQPASPVSGRPAFAREYLVIAEARALMERALPPAVGAHSAGRNLA